MIHLICLRCNHANASEAKFCSECGAGLLRKFCGRCRAINDAESHFCQSCGEALPAQPSVTHATSITPPAVVPDLTDVYAEAADSAPALDSASGPASDWADEPTVAVPHAAAAVPASAPVTARPSQRTVLFGFVGGAALLLAVLLWSKTEHPNAPLPETPGSVAPSVAAPHTAPTAVAAPAPAAPAPAPDNAGSRDTAGAAIAPAPASEAAKAPERRLSPEAQVAAQPPAAGPAPRPVATERKPTVRNTPPPSPPPDCTPQVDALGLCAPGAKVADRSGSR